MAIRTWSPRDALQPVLMKLSMMMDVEGIFLHQQVENDYSLGGNPCACSLHERICFSSVLLEKKNNNRRMRKSAEHKMCEWSCVVSLRTLEAIMEVLDCEVWESLLIRLEIIGDAT